MGLYLVLTQQDDQLLNEQTDLFNADNFTRLTKQKFLIKLLKEHAARKAGVTTGSK